MDFRNMFTFDSDGAEAVEDGGGSFLFLMTIAGAIGSHQFL